MSDTITVIVRDRATEYRTWGMGRLWSPCLRTITLPRYTARGERRSDPTMQACHEDGESFGVSRWTLDSGRVETYAEAVAAAVEERHP